MFKCTKNLLYSQEKHKFDVKDNEMMKIANNINCLKEKIIYAKIRSRKNQKIINNLQEQSFNLCNEFYATKCLAKNEQKHNISSISVDTDYIIDVQNELKTTEKKLQLLRNILAVCEDQKSKLRVQLNLTDQKMKQSEKDRAQQQILCAKAEITSLQYRIQKNQEWDI